MFSYITEISNQQLEAIVGHRISLYKEFNNKVFNHNINVYEKTIIYYQEKAHPFIADIQKQFSENYFTSTRGRQRELNGYILNILKDYMYRSIYSNDQNLIREALEKAFKLYQINPNYGEPLLDIFSSLNQNQALQPQIKAQLSKYIQQLGQANKQK